METYREAAMKLRMSENIKNARGYINQQIETLTIAKDFCENQATYMEQHENFDEEDIQHWRTKIGNYNDVIEMLNNIEEILTK